MNGDDAGGKPPDPIRCYVIGDNKHKETLFKFLARTCGYRATELFTYFRDITVTWTRTAGVGDGDGDCAGDTTPTPWGTAEDHNIQACSKLTLWETTTQDKAKRKGGTKLAGYIFHRKSSRLDEIYSIDYSESCKRVVLVLYTVEDPAPRDILSKMLGREVVEVVPVVMINLSAEEEVAGEKLLHTLTAIEIAFVFSAFKIVKWTPSNSGSSLGSLLSLISEASKQTLSLRKYPPEMQEDVIQTTKPTDLQPMSSPVMMNINSATVTEAHMIMNLVHKYHRDFPTLTAGMALRTWLIAKNWAAVGVVCRAHSLTQFEDIDLSNLPLDSIPEELRGLSFRTLNLSHNKITKIPEWLAEMPNVIWGKGPESMILHEVEQRRNCVKIETHKLVFVGDAGAGKTTLLKCMMKSKNKLLFIRHVPTGLAVYNNVSFSGNARSWTVWDLGGESLEPFHPWFLLSRSIFILVFEVRDTRHLSESFKNPRLYYWLNELSVARSRGDKKRRTIIPVGTHMEGVPVVGPTVQGPFSALSSHLEPIFKYENIPVVFLLQLSDGQGWKCKGPPIRTRHSSKGVEMLLSHLESDLPSYSVPQSWVVLNKELTKSREKGGISTLSWTQFVQLAWKCGVATGTTLKTEECAHFLAEIGTIIHFRYPFYLQSPNHPGAAATPGLAELVIVDPHSFLVRLLANICSLSQPNIATPKFVFSSETGPALETILCDFGIIIGSPLCSVHLSPFDSPHSAEEDKYFRAFWQTPNDRAYITQHLNARVIFFEIFQHELFIKVISSVPNYAGEGTWNLQFWSRDVAFFSNPGLGALFITCKGERLTICLRSTGKGVRCTQFQQNVWTAIMSTIHRLIQLRYCRFEETESPLFPLVVNYGMESYPCPHCLLKGLTSQTWLNPSRSNVLPPTRQSWYRNLISDAVKNGKHVFTCEGNCEVQLNAMAPDLIKELETLNNRSGTELAATVIPAQFSEILGQGLPQHITLEHLLTRLLEKGNGTTSVLDQVIPSRLRCKILRDVAQGLGGINGLGLHTRDPAVVHGRISSSCILVLSLDDSGTGPWAKIMDSDRSCTVLSDQTRIPESPFSLADLKFVAPEVISHLFFDTKADVWSFGMTCSLTMDPLNQPFTHITSNRKYMCTDYTSPTTTSSTASHNRNKYRLGLNPLIVSRHLLRGDITPFPPSPPSPSLDGGGTHNVDVLRRLVMQVASLCLCPNPKSRPPMANIVKIWDYFQPPNDGL
ncbi:hypothetical protein Pelo_15032 [Pelomyxa schiedti]|nr:hypothetical protein Pelo_15032 [Pelomyxa schiedti]